MTDLLSIGASGINVYKRALSTVSNNIANMGTEGYSRQVTDIKQTDPTESGGSFIGNGAYFDRVSRQYDAFLESSLQQATADLESQGASVEYTNRLLDVIGDEKIGATSALTQFFAAAKALSTDPASTALRGAMLRDAEQLVSRFNGLSAEFDSLNDQAFSAMEADVKSLNGLAEQIASVNRNLLKKKLEKDQSPQLLDQRDQLLRDISQYAGITTNVDSQGLVTVSLGQSTKKGLLVKGVDAFQLSVSQPDPQSSALAFEVKGGIENETLSSVLSGSISGYANFIENTLTQVRSQLNNLVGVLANEVNAIQTTGLDAFGDQGADFFQIEPGVLIDKGASRGDFEVLSSVTDIEQLQPGSYAFTWNAASQSWVADSSVKGAQSSLDASVSIDGLLLRSSGQPLDGDRFVATVFSDPASGFQLGITDGAQIATASLFRITPATQNSGSVNPQITYEEPTISEPVLKPGSQTVAASSLSPVGVVEAGQSQLSLTLDPARDASLAINLITRDGRHLVGGTGVSDFGTLVESSDFFATNASYTDLYLNKSGSSNNSYNDFNIEIGAFGSTTSVTEVLPISGEVVALPSSVDFTSGYLEFTAQLSEENMALGFQQSQFKDTTAGAISIVGTSIYRGLGSTTEKIADIQAPSGPSNPSYDTVKVSFVDDLSSVEVSVLDQIANRLTFSNGSDLTATNYHVYSSVSVKAVSGDELSQWAGSFSINTEELVKAGAINPVEKYVSTLRGKDIPAASSGLGDVIEASKVSVNGSVLGALTVGQSGIDGYGKLSVLDIKNWIESSSPSGVTVSVQNNILINPANVQLLGAGLTINGHDVISVDSGTNTQFSDLDDLVDSINAKSAVTGVAASIDLNGDLRLSDPSGGNIQLGSSVDNLSANLLGVSNGVFVGQYEIEQISTSETPLKVELTPSGAPSDLNAVGLDTTVIVSGEITEDIGVFIQGSDGTSTSTLTTALTTSGESFSDGVRSRVYELEFVNSSTYRITDQATNTIMAERAYAGETTIKFQGMVIELDRPGEAGDSFSIDGNNTGPNQTFDAQGNNSNILRMVALESEPVVNGSMSMTEAYLDFVGDVGNQATQAQISQDALSIVKDQAIEARDRVSGVNLDEEAADLIRFQQAYQASAQVMQVATKLFDTMLQVR